jgi:phospholipid/cholesterol/gamma-HCH transport system permease protein
VTSDRSDNHKAETEESGGGLMHEVGEEIVEVASVPGQITYEAIHNFLEFLGEVAVLLGKTLRFVFAGSINFADTINQMSVIGVSSLPIVVITVAFSGAVLALYMAQLIVAWGVGGYTGAVVGLSITREIAPVLTAVVVAARCGSAIAAEIGSMKVTEQIDALRALAVSPLQYLVVPRLLAAIVMLPVLCVMADVVGTYAGYLVATVNGVASGGYIGSLKAQVIPRDITMGMLKTVVFAVVIVMVGARQGLRTSGGATGVGRATTSAVVISIVLIYILNFLLAYVMFGGKTAFL